jgi:DNA-binding HxlR family transcriptional regulator
LCHVPAKPKSKRRSGCPVSVSLEIFGDAWSLLILRDLMVRGYRKFKEFHNAGEGIATNILSDRLQKLEAAGILDSEPEETDGRSVNYRLTEKGIDLAPATSGVDDLGGAARDDGASLCRDPEDGKESRRSPRGSSAKVEGMGPGSTTTQIWRVALAVSWLHIGNSLHPTVIVNML